MSARPCGLHAALLLLVLGTACAGPSEPPAAIATEPALRVLPGAPEPSLQRSATRRSLLYFGQLTDLHVTDSMSPLRLEMLDPAATGDGRFHGSWRPQETMTARVVDRAVRRMNERRRSPVVQGDGSRAAMALVLVTGDLVDNRQHNELSWATAALAGRVVVPFSGRAPGPWECPLQSLARRTTLATRVTTGGYSGVQRHAQYPPEVPAARRAAFYDPAEPAPTRSFRRRPGRTSRSGPRYDLPAYPGILERALRPFETEGLAVPWYVARGNHDALVQGRYEPLWIEAIYGRSANDVATGCYKAYPSAALDPDAPPFDDGDYTPERRLAVLRQLRDVYGSGAAQPPLVAVPPAVRRALFDPGAFVQGLAGFPDEAGYAFAAAEAVGTSPARPYAWAPAPGLLFVSLDTPVERGGLPSSGGNLDAAQFAWLARLLESTARDTLVVVFAHHDLASLDNPASPGCRIAGAGCGDPPPVHLGCPSDDDGLRCDAPYVAGAPRNLRDLLLAHPKVVLLVNGHTHVNRIEPFTDGAGHGFWQVTTASVVEWPQQGRTLELLDNGDGTLSIVGRLVPAFPEALEWPRVAARELDDAGIAAVAHLLAAGDQQWRSGRGRDALGRIVSRGASSVNLDGDVELVVPDPRPPAAASP